MSTDIQSAPACQPKAEHQHEQTFRGYTVDQAKEYATSRRGYPPRLVEEVIKAHTDTGGALGTVLDLGCGPGNSTRDLAVHFDHAIGLDPGASMVSAATQLGGDARNGPINFVQGEAEVCEGIPDQSVDLVSAANQVTGSIWIAFGLPLHVY